MGGQHGQATPTSPLHAVLSYHKLNQPLQILQPSKTLLHYISVQNVWAVLGLPKNTRYLDGHHPLQSSIDRPNLFSLELVKVSE
jgi:hypothetical protein